MAGRTLKECFLESFSRYGAKRAITFLRDGRIETELSYRDLDRDSNQMANTFMEMGVAKGDRVILFFQKSLAFVIAHLALQKLGATAVPLNPGFKKSEMSYFIKDTEPTLILSEPERKSMVEQIAAGLNIVHIETATPYQDVSFFRTSPDSLPKVGVREKDPGLIIYTSGTTGKPKGAVLTHKNLVHDAMNVIKIWEITGSDVICHALPLFHVHGLCFALHTALMVGAHVMMLDRFSPSTVVEVLTTKEGRRVCTVFMAVPSMYGKLLDYLEGKNLDFSHLRLLTSGSAPLLVKDFERIKQTFGKEPVEREGMSETGMNFSNPLHGVRKPGSIGLPLPGLQVRIVDPETLIDVEPGQTGEFWLKGDGISPGYWRKPQETEKAFRDGWFRTGDLGRMDEEGYYYLTDRLKHIIISGGENISPKEVESVINRLDDVVESCVVGIPDEKWGEKVVAAVVKKPRSLLHPEEVKRFCKKHLHDWKCPKEIMLTTDLPKNTMGKVLKEEVKKLFMARNDG